MRKMLACVGLLLVPNLATCLSARRRMIGPPNVEKVTAPRPELASPGIEVGEWTGPWNATIHDTFMRDFWQKRPLLVRGAFPELRSSPLMRPEELCRMACINEEDFSDDELDTADEVSYGADTFEAGLDIRDDENDVAARLILNQRQVIHGPFDLDGLEELCAAHPGAWSLLVNDLERHSSKVHALVEAFSIVPTWRHDDVMISLAPTGGGIGAHVDSYDVFLLQGSGSREWEIDSRYLSTEDETASLINDGREVRVLQASAFRATHRWILEPGDFLYLPPRVAHRGKSLSNDCTTVSVGFRLPAVRELVAYFADHVTSQGRLLDASGARLKHDSSEFNGVADVVSYDGESPSLSMASRKARSSGRIDPSGVAEAKEVIRAALLAELDDDVAFGQWFGSTVTAPQRADTAMYAASDTPDRWDADDESQASVVLAEVAGAECLEALASSTRDESRGTSSPQLMRRLGVKLAFLEGYARASQAGTEVVGGKALRANATGGCLFADGFSLQYGAAAGALVEELCERRLQRKPLSTEMVLNAAMEDKSEVIRLLDALLLRGVLYLEMD